MYILLILVAWQYRYSFVIVFTLGIIAFDIALMEISPPPHIPKFFPSERELSITYGRMITSTISYLVLGYIVNRLINAQRKQRRQLADANLKLVQHANTVEQLSISRERNRLSRELHDTLAHTLSALAVQFDALATVWETIPDKARQLIEGMQVTTLSGLGETRRALSALRASPLEEMGLALALQELFQDFADRQELDLQMDIHEGSLDISPEVEQCYYRVAQEALENIARHANARKMDVCLLSKSSGLVMIISDDGCGFDLSEELQGHQLGIQGMHERAGIIGADLQVESQPGAGTTLRLVLGGNA
jgi:signal transduction histidine kinase